MSTTNNLPEWMQPTKQASLDQTVRTFKHASRLREWFKMPAQYYVTSQGTIFGKRDKATLRKLTIHFLFKLAVKYGKYRLGMDLATLLMTAEEKDTLEVQLTKTLYNQIVFNPILGYIGSED